VTHDALRRSVREYYENKLRQHAATAAGVDWSSQSSQELRFRQFERLWADEPDASVVDYGCGYGALAGYLRTRGHRGPYVGFDLSAKMIEAASEHTRALRSCRFTSRRGEVPPGDYAVASGILNVKQEASADTWEAFVRETIADLASLGDRGFGLNALTTRSDPEKRSSHLYYADPVRMFEYCQQTYSRSVALLHDYPLWEFTILVKRQTV
jgi:SAM-dependent methyltransferase